MMNEIEKKIHYCWFGKSELTDEAQKCIESWKKFCPDYEIVRWDEDNFDFSACRYAAQAYSMKKWAFVSDYARFVILYENGGIYFDTDVELIKPIDDIVANGAFMGCQPGRKIEINPGLGIGTSKGNELYEEIIEYYKSQNFIDDGNMNLHTVVDRLTKIMRNAGFIGSGEIEKVRNISIYPPEYFCPINCFTNEVVITEKTRSIHHYSASWLDKDERRIMDKVAVVEKKYGRIPAMVTKNVFYIGKEAKTGGIYGVCKYIRNKLYNKLYKKELF